VAEAPQVRATPNKTVLVGAPTAWNSLPKNASSQHQLSSHFGIRSRHCCFKRLSISNTTNRPSNNLGNVGRW